MTRTSRRWRQLSVRGGLILVTLFAVFLGWRANVWHARDRAIRRIRELGGGVVKLPQPGTPNAEACAAWFAWLGVPPERGEQALEVAGILPEHYGVYNNGRHRSHEVVAECRALGKAGEVRLFLADSDITDDGLRSLAGVTVRELYLGSPTVASATFETSRACGSSGCRCVPSPTQPSRTCWSCVDRTGRWCASSCRIRS
jgi:hypothetical protein